MSPHSPSPRGSEVQAQPWGLADAALWPMVPGWGSEWLQEEDEDGG